LATLISTALGSVTELAARLVNVSENTTVGTSVGPVLLVGLPQVHNPEP
jgi:hypothetical protein